MSSEEEKRAKRNEYMRQWNEKNAERLRSVWREAYYKNREEKIKRVADYKRRNREKVRQWDAVYREKHADEIKAYTQATKHLQAIRSKRKYEKRKKEILEYGKRYYLENKRQVLKRNAEWRKANRDRVREVQREYKKRKLRENPAFYFIENTRKRMLNALKGVGSKSARTVELLGCTGEEAVKYIERKFLPGMSWKNRSEWHIDHIKPLCKFDLTDPEQQKRAFNYTNLQPLWARDNRSKGGK